MSNSDGTRYTDKAKWVDANAYSDMCDQSKLYWYIKDICEATARRRRMFKSAEEYEDFSNYIASKIFMRYKDKRQSEDRSGFKKKKVSKIKSIVNYVKKTIYFEKLQFENESFIDTWHKKDIEEDTPPMLMDTMDYSIAYMRDVEFRSSMHDIPKTIRNYMSRIPRKINSDEWHNIYISVLLTVYDYMTLSDIDKRRLAKIQKRKDYLPSDIDRIYRAIRNRDATLYRLSDEYGDYIKILARKVFREVSNDLSETLAYFTTANDMVADIINGENREFDYEN